jgi:hypothetical protein
MLRYTAFFTGTNRIVSSAQVGEIISAVTAVVRWVLHSVKIVSNSLGVSSLQAITDSRSGAAKCCLFVKHFASHLGALIVMKRNLAEQATHRGTHKKQIVLQQQAGRIFSQAAFYF